MNRWNQFRIIFKRFSRFCLICVLVKYFFFAIITAQQPKRRNLTACGVLDCKGFDLPYKTRAVIKKCNRVPGCRPGFHYQI